MSMLVDDIVAAYRALLRIVRERPYIPLAVALLMAATDLLAERAGFMDGITLRHAAKAAVALFVLPKLLVMLAAYIGFVRLAGDTRLGIAAVLALSGRQLKWLGATFVLLLGLLGVMIGLKLAMLALVAALGLSNAVASVLAMLVYLVVELTLMARLLPAFAGVMIGDPAAGLGWSWARTRGRIVATVVLMLALIIPLQVLHGGLTIAAVAQQGGVRMALILLDGGAMALILAAIGCAHRQLYVRAAAARPDAGFALATN
jgi:hypothetical protein